MSQSAGLHAVPTAMLRAADAVKAEVNVEQFLAPTLKRDDVVFMDNVRSTR
jgi:hypothetical protein